MLLIDVPQPLRTPERYAFECQVRVQRSVRQRLVRHVRGAPRPATRVPSTVRFGFRTTGWQLEHHPVWDAIYPLMALTRYGGPLYGTRYRRARIRLASPVPQPVRDFYVRRACDLGLEIAIEAPASDATFDGAVHGHVLAFGGGKESRVILGMLREIGDDPTIVSSWAAMSRDQPSALVSEPHGSALVDRLIPALMRRGAHLYIGGTLGAAHRVTPWHRYYDMSAPGPVRETSALLASVGLPTRLHTPLSVAPPNIGQWVLADRYPELFAHQTSTREEATTEKNLHVALCRHHHGIPYEPHCPPALFQRLLERFVDRELARPDDFGPSREREVISREMRAIIHRHRAEPPFASVCARIPDDWAGDWIDHLHPYVEPEPIPGIAAILGRYATSVDEAPVGARLWRVPA